MMNIKLVKKYYRNQFKGRKKKSSVFFFGIKITINSKKIKFNSDTVSEEWIGTKLQQNTLIIYFQRHFQSLRTRKSYFLGMTLGKVIHLLNFR